MRYQFVDEIVFRHLGRSRLPLLLEVPDCRLEGVRRGRPAARG
jgi:hypothetical protein